MGQNDSTIFRRPVFWFILLLSGAASALVCVRLFSTAFPMSRLEIRMDREAALKKARELADEHGWGPDNYLQAAKFIAKTYQRDYIELEGGGKDAFFEVLEDDFWEPYVWVVRHFKPHETEQTWIYFDADGNLDRFERMFSEKRPGPTLSEEEARAIAEGEAITVWHFDLSQVEPIEHEIQNRPGGRRDHKFHYLRRDKIVGEATYRLSLGVSGDQLSQIGTSLKVPYDFGRRHREMRSANHTLDQIATVSSYILFFGTALAGVYVLEKQRWIIWRGPIIIGFLVAALVVIAGICTWPLQWVDYDTTTSAADIFASRAVGVATGLIFLTTLLGGLFTAAESMGRRAFPQQIQITRIWSRGAVNTIPALGLTVGGYLLAVFDLSYDAVFYDLASKIPGWWIPIHELAQPDLLATSIPALVVFGYSLMAGFEEECLFRAIPLAGAALLGRRLGQPKLWIALTLIVQALLFGGAHADYPQQPYYARLIELFLPALVYGMVYFRFGLYPVVIAHTIHNCVLGSIPLFVSSSPSAVINQMAVIGLLLFPLGIAAINCLRHGLQREIHPDFLNRSWSPPKERIRSSITMPPFSLSIPRRNGSIVVFLGIFSLVIWWLYSVQREHDVPALMIKRDEAEAAAVSFLKSTWSGFDPTVWRIDSTVRGEPGAAGQFVWETGGRETYRRLIDAEYLRPPHWVVYFRRYDVEVEERARRFEVFVDPHGTVFRYIRRLPEGAEGPSLTEENARSLVLEAASMRLHLPADQLREVAIRTYTRTSRRDWKFVFAVDAHNPLDEGETRLEVLLQGDTIAEFRRHIHVPEDWMRDRSSYGTRSAIVRAIAVVICAIMICAAGLIIYWQRGKSRYAGSMGLLVLAIGCLPVAGLIFCSWPGAVADFDTAEPFRHQVMMWLLRALLMSAFVLWLVPVIFAEQAATRRKQMELPWNRGGILGFFLGSSLIGLHAIVSLTGSESVPSWPAFPHQDATLPWLNATSLSVAVFLLLAALLTLVPVWIDRFSYGWTQRRPTFALATTVFGMSLSAAFTQEVLLWFIGGVLFAGFLILSYVYVYRYHSAVIFPTAGSAAGLWLIQETFTYPFSGAVLGMILTIIALYLSSRVLYHFWGKAEFAPSN